MNTELRKKIKPRDSLQEEYAERKGKVAVSTLLPN